MVKQLTDEQYVKQEIEDINERIQEKYEDLQKFLDDFKILMDDADTLSEFIKNNIWGMWKWIKTKNKIQTKKKQT